MQMQGNRELSVSQEIAWGALNDPEVLKGCIPGCDRFELSGENQYAIGMVLKIGPISAKFSGQINLLNVQAPSAYTIKFEGQGGPAGFGKGESNVVLEPQENGCLLTYTVKAQMGGKVAQLGQRLIDGAANKMADDFFKRFESHLIETHAKQAPPAADTEVLEPQPIQATTSLRPWLAAVAIAGVAGVVAWWLVSSGV